MTDEITESKMLDFCNDLKELFEKYQVVLKFNTRDFEWKIIPFEQNRVDYIIEDIENNFYETDN